MLELVIDEMAGKCMLMEGKWCSKTNDTRYGTTKLHWFIINYHHYYTLIIMILILTID